MWPRTNAHATFEGGLKSSRGRPCCDRWHTCRVGIKLSRRFHAMKIQFHVFSVVRCCWLWFLQELFMGILQLFGSHGWIFYYYAGEIVLKSITWLLKGALWFFLLDHHLFLLVEAVGRLRAQRRGWLRDMLLVPDEAPCKLIFPHTRQAAFHRIG